MMSVWRRSENIAEDVTMEKILQRTDERNQLTALVAWIVEALERAAVRQHDRYVARANNPRELAQRLHQIEQGGQGFHA